MDNSKTQEIKKLIANKIKSTKGTLSYETLASKADVTAARISDAANNKIDFRISTLIEIATALRVSPKDLFDIDFDFEKYYKHLDKE